MTEDNDELDFGWVDATDEHETVTPGDAQAPAAASASEPTAVRTRRSSGATVGGGASRRRPSHRRIQIRRAVAFLALAIVGFAAWFAWSLFQPFGGKGTGGLQINIPRGATTSQIGDALAKRGVVDSAFFFKLRADLDGDGSKFHAGVYQLRYGMSYAAALAALTAPPKVVEIAVTIPEGFTREQIAARAAADGLTGNYLLASRPSVALKPSDYGAPSSVHSLEGFLFPATYFDFQRGSVKLLVAQQLAAFEDNFNQINFHRAAAAGLSRYDVLIIASMIEREAQVPGDRALVSAVIWNRLKARIPLGIDATLRYALGDYTQPLTASQLQLDTPYNTRLHRGLPPTPISNPGLASMIAAANPARVSYLYYVNKPNTCGKLAFATTYAEFQADVNAYNAARNANGGRAPTKCP
jgi:UPF0755 protein